MLQGRVVWQGGLSSLAMTMLLSSWSPQYNLRELKYFKKLIHRNYYACKI